MIKKYSLILISFILITLIAIPGIVIASDISDAEYDGTVRITNNSTTASPVFVPFSLNPSSLISSNYTLATLLDTSIQSNAGADVAYMPANPTSSNWCVYVPSILNSGVLDYKLYLGGGSDMNSKIRYFPGSTGMTTLDSATLELGDNFTITQSGYIDITQSGANITSKEDSLRTFIASSGNITSQIDKGYVDPTGNTDPSSQWSNETNIYDNDTGTFATDFVGGVAYSAWIQLERTPSMSKGCRWYFSGVADFTLVEVDAYYDGGWYDLTDGAIALTISDWQTQEFADQASHLVNQYRLRFYNSDPGANDARLAELDFIDVSEVSISGLSSGERIIEVSSDNNSTFWGQKIDATTADFPISDNLVFNAPFYHPDLATANFKTKDTNGNELRSTGTIWSSSGRVFAGSGNISLASAFSDISTNKQFTVVIWYYHTGGRFLICNLNSANDRFAVDINGTDIRVSTYNGTAYRGTKSGTSTASTWHQMAFTFNPDTVEGKLYLDLTSLTGGNNAGLGLTTTGFRIGQRTDNAVPFEGTIGEVEIYDRVLTLPEITGLYNTSSWKYNGSSDLFHYDLLPATGVLDNANNWNFINSYSVPYFEYQEITINGIQQQYIDWEYTSGNFTDDSGNGHDANPSYRTTSSDADVSAYLLLFSPISPLTADNWTVSSYGSMASTLSEPTGMYSELDVSHIPGSDLIADVFASSSTPVAIFWFTLPFFVMIIFGLLVYKYTQSLLTQYVVMIIVYIGFAAMGPVPLWPVYLFAVIGLACVVGSKHYAW